MSFRVLCDPATRPYACAAGNTVAEAVSNAKQELHDLNQGWEFFETTPDPQDALDQLKALGDQAVVQLKDRDGSTWTEVYLLVDALHLPPNTKTLTDMDQRI